MSAGDRIRERRKGLVYMISFWNRNQNQNNPPAFFLVAVNTTSNTYVLQ